MRVRSAGGSVDLPVPTGASFGRQNTMPVAVPGLAAPPVTRSVPVPGLGGAAGRPVVHRSVTQHNDIHIATTDPRAAAAEAVRLLEQQQRQRRDAEHPLEDDDA